MSDREFLLLFRQALLLMVDAIERKLGMSRTSELRKAGRENTLSVPAEGTCIPAETGV